MSAGKQKNPDVRRIQIGNSVGRVSKWADEEINKQAERRNRKGREGMMHNDANIDTSVTRCNTHLDERTASMSPSSFVRSFIRSFSSIQELLVPRA